MFEELLLNSLQEKLISKKLLKVFQNKDYVKIVFYEMLALKIES
jgi:hypothetical protein